MTGADFGKTQSPSPYYRVIAGQQPVPPATEDKALLTIVTAGQRPTKGDGAACDRVDQQKKDAGAAMRHKCLQQQRRNKRVQDIALCEKLGLTYSTKNNLPAPCK